MTAKVQMMGAMTSLSHTLDHRRGEAQADPQVFTHWFGTSSGCNAVLGNVAGWSAPPPDSGAYVGPTAHVVFATNRLAIVTGKKAWLDALVDADAAIAEVAAVL